MRVTGRRRQERHRVLEALAAVLHEPLLLGIQPQLRTVHPAPRHSEAFLSDAPREYHGVPGVVPEHPDRHELVVHARGRHLHWVPVLVELGDGLLAAGDTRENLHHLVEVPPGLLEGRRHGPRQEERSHIGRVPHRQLMPLGFPDFRYATHESTIPRTTPREATSEISR